MVANVVADKNREIQGYMTGIVSLTLAEREGADLASIFHNEKIFNEMKTAEFRPGDRAIAGFFYPSELNTKNLVKLRDIVKDAGGFLNKDGSTICINFTNNAQLASKLENVFLNTCAEIIKGKDKDEAREVLNDYFSPDKRTAVDKIFEIAEAKSGHNK